tara:strand:- start:288 stop:497 length:210 start_codon:yes stop_codon:yes gene_type:complete
MVQISKGLGPKLKQYKVFIPGRAGNNFDKVYTAESREHAAEMAYKKLKATGAPFTINEVLLYTKEDNGS